MNIYFDTGFFIDYFSSRTMPAVFLRTKGRRGRSIHQIQEHAHNIMNKISAHSSRTSIITIQEYADTSFKKLNQMIKGTYNKKIFFRNIIKTESSRLYNLCNQYGIQLVSLNSIRIHDAITNSDYDGLDFYDAIHIKTARDIKTNLIISTDSDFLKCSNVFDNIKILDTDDALKLI